MFSVWPLGEFVNFHCCFLISLLVASKPSDHGKIAQMEKIVELLKGSSFVSFAGRGARRIFQGSEI